MRIGIDLGGTNIAGGLVSESGELVYRANAPTDSSRGEAGLCEDILSVIEKIRSDNPTAEIKSIGIGVPGHVDRDTELVIFCNNIPFKNTDLKGYITRATGIETHIGNDANAAALGEVLAGVAKEYNDAVMITLGTGVGSGLIFNKKVYSGFNGAAGEVGHISLVPNGIPCACGRHGCFELYASATALKRQTREAMEKNPDSKLWEFCGGKIENANPKTAFDAMQAGDKVASFVIDKYIEYLAMGITDVINLLQPEAIIFGGGVSRQGENLLAPLRERIALLGYAKEGPTTVLLAAKLGNDAGIIGAAFFGV